MRALTVLVLLLPARFAPAADADGNFAIKGAGRATCQRYLDERKTRSANYRLFGGWINGYLTAYNQLTDQTFDVAPWEATDTLAAALANFCRQNPEQLFFVGVTRMARALSEARLTENSLMVRTRVGENYVYQEILKRAQRKLKELGHYDGPVDGQFGDATRAAFEAYQTEQSLEASGLPDQFTLLKLFRG